MNKRGQFYLVAAIVLVVIIISFATIQNYTRRKSAIKIYDIKEELGIESGNVLDYGTFNIADDEERRDLIENFSEEYIAYAGEGRNLSLIFGDYKQMWQITYEEVIVGEVGVQGIGKGTSRLDIIGSRIKIEEIQPTYEQNGNVYKIEVELAGTKYDFELKPGENFYFIISEEIGGEQHVVVS